MEDYQLIAFTERLLEHQSHDREASDVPELIVETLEEYGAEPEVLEREGVRNVVATTGGKPKTLLNGHWDTVPPASDGEDEALPEVRRESGMLYGLGASDMKSGVAAQVAAFLECLDRDVRGVMLAIVGDEEVGGANGTPFTIEQGYLAPYVVLGEPTNLRISLGQKGAMRVDVTSHGSAAHGAYPHQGENAIVNMCEFLEHLGSTYPVPDKESDNLEVFHQVTASIGTIKAGKVVNVVPDRCRASVDVRIPPQITAREVGATIRSLAEEHGVEVAIKFKGHGWQLEQATRLYEASRDAVEEVTGEPLEFVQKLGSNDGMYYAREGAHITNVGPGDHRFSHRQDERVRVSNIPQARDIYVKMAQLLAQAPRPAAP